MSTRIEMLRRLNDIMQRRIELARELAPFYQAGSMLFSGSASPEEMFYVLEAHPIFRPLWLEDQDLRNEWTKLLLDLG